ncbi:disease resistance protein Pik-2-like [Phragmites australis]|uniref:disease resistance protein Pik-2-like n=1 Tax=Phragmites australis TaxID=29695 RepID=UPI002D78F310|nr:disease resistance protein Pik-2-like [Phragmites australis]
MEKFMVSAATRVMNSLLSKLAALLEKEYKLLKGVKRDIIFLKDELTSLNLLLLKLADIEDLDVQDCIDIFMHSDRPKASLVRKTADKTRKLWLRHEIGKQIQELITRVMEESARRYRYRLDDSTSRPREVETDHPLTALFVEANKFEGIDSPMGQMEQWLTGKGKSNQELKVVSIVGFGGSGKTTLALQAYNKLRDNFACAAFISVSRNPRIQKDLMDILKDVGAHINTTDDEGRLVNKLRGYLTKKR